MARGTPRVVLGPDVLGAAASRACIEPGTAGDDPVGEDASIPAQQVPRPGTVDARADVRDRSVLGAEYAVPRLRLAQLLVHEAGLDHGLVHLDAAEPGPEPTLLDEKTA